MLTRTLLKLIRSLDTRKGRRKEGLFVAEGPRLVGELTGHFRQRALFVTEAAAKEHPEWDAETITEEEMARASLQQTPQGVLALFEIPTYEVDVTEACTSQLCLALDGIQDPGNLGTIVRVADWFGVKHIFCSDNTCDVWNPKTVQATMGGISRVRVHYFNLPQLLASLPAEVPVYGTSLQGDDLWTAPLTAQGIVVMGNEGNGMTEEVKAFCQRQLLIPPYPTNRQTIESLNVGMATGIVLAEFRRRLSS